MPSVKQMFSELLREVRDVKRRLSFPSRESTHSFVEMKNHRQRLSRGADTHFTNLGDVFL
jgi:hypothetical protein